MRTVLLFLFLLFSGMTAFAENKVALVIGIDAYPRLGVEQQLKKARNDARSLAKSLEEIGFDVILGLDQGRTDINRKLNEFGQLLSPGDVAFVFFSGHGIELQNQNYLLPSDFPRIGPSDEQLLRGEAINLQFILDLLSAKGTRVNLIVIDACRNNPLGSDQPGRGIGGNRGLARVEPPVGTFVMYSAAARQIALDRLNDKDSDPNSIFTRLLLPQMAKKDLPIQAVAKTLQTEVRDLALTVSHDQRPAYYDGIVGHFCLSGSNVCGSEKTVATAPVEDEPKPEGAPSPGRPVTAAPLAEKPSDEVQKATADSRKLAGEIAFLQCTRQNTPDCYQAFVRDYPDHPRTGQVPKILENEVATPLYQECMAGELVKCNRYRQVFPKGAYTAEVEKKIVELTRRPEPGMEVDRQPSDTELLDTVPPGNAPRPEDEILNVQVPSVDSEKNATASVEIAALPPSVPEESRRGIRILSDVDLPGNDYHNRREVSLKACRAECENDERCSGFSWVPSKRWCWMKSAPGTEVSREGMISGIKTDLRSAHDRPAAPSITTYPNLDLSGTDYANYKGMDLDRCTTSCAQDGQCVAFSWVAAKEWCWLKSTVGRSEARDGITSGAKKSLPQNAAASVSPGRMMTYKNIDLLGNDYGNYRDVSLDQCAGACARDNRCVAFSWVESKRWCWLKSSVSPPSVNRDRVSGVKP